MLDPDMIMDAPSFRSRLVNIEMRQDDPSFDFNFDEIENEFRVKKAERAKRRRENPTNN